MLTAEDNVKEKRVLAFWILFTACLGERVILVSGLLSASADGLP